METADRVGERSRDKHAIPTQNLFRRIIGKAEGREMRGNSGKTAMLCISDAMSYDAGAHIFSQGDVEIRSGPTLRVLGFHFSARPTMHAHVEAIRKCVRQRYWCLYHLRKAGFTDDELAKVYRTVILPIFDYCTPVYHSFLTEEQDQII